MEPYTNWKTSEERLNELQYHIGYLIWFTLPQGDSYPHYLNDPGLANLLEHDLSAYQDVYRRELHVAKKKVFDAIIALKEREIKHVRLGVSWAEGDTVGGFAWITWYIRTFRQHGFTILPNINYTPHRFAVARIEQVKKEAEASGDAAWIEYAHQLRPLSNTPPFPLTSVTEYLERVHAELGDCFSEKVIEFWNEVNIPTDWENVLDPDLTLFTEMVEAASQKIHALGYRVLLGGLSGLKLDTAHQLGKNGLYDHIDIMGLHGLRGTWGDKEPRPSWGSRILTLQSVMQEYTGRHIPVWLTETGFCVHDLEFKVPLEELERVQTAIFAELLLVLLEGSTERVYWYTLFDSPPGSRSLWDITTNWPDTVQFFFGDTDMCGTPKLLGELLMKGGPRRVLEYVTEHGLWEEAGRILNRGDPKLWEGKFHDVFRKAHELAVARANERGVSSGP